MFAAESDGAVLAGLVGDVDAFGRDHWGRKPLLRSAGERWARLLTVDDVESLLLTGSRPPTFRLVQEGETLPPARSTRPVRLAGELLGDVADVSRIGEAMATGATLVLQGLQRTSLGIAELCRSLERATSHAVQANAYLTPAGAMGLSSHRDEHDVIVVQQSGSKAWSIDGLGDGVTLEPGDVLYMPAGTEHSASTQAGPSLHLTIGILTTTWAAVVRRMIDGIDALDAPLPLGFAHDDVEADLVARLAEVLDVTARALAGTDVAGVASAEARRARHRRRPLLTGHLGDVLDSGSIALDTVVRRRVDQPAELAGAGERVEVVLPDRRIGFPAIGRAALERLLAGGPVAVGELRGIDDPSKVVVARRLVREGVLAVIV